MDSLREQVSSQPPHTVNRAQRKRRAVIGKPAVQVTQPRNHAILLDPPYGLGMIQPGIHMHIPSGGPIGHQQDQSRQKHRIPPAALTGPFPPINSQRPATDHHNDRTRRHQQHICPKPHSRKKAEHLGIYRYRRKPRHQDRRHLPADSTRPASGRPAGRRTAPFKRQQYRKANQKCRNENISPVEQHS